MDDKPGRSESSCSGIQIKTVSVDAIVELRHQVLRAGLPRDTALFEGDRDASSIHLAAINGDRVIGCVTLHASRWEDRPAWQLRGMAVAPDHQKNGMGRELLRSVDELVAGRQSRLLWCNARVPAAGFYQKHGWEIVSDVFEIPTAGPHVRMVKPGGLP